MLAKRSLNLCLQVLNSSDHSFRLADSGGKIIWIYSLMNKFHFLVTGLKGFALPSKYFPIYIKVFVVILQLPHIG